MLQFEKLRLALEKLRPDINDLADTLRLQGMKKEISQLGKQAAIPSLWGDMEHSQRILQCSSMLKSRIANYEKLCSSLGDALTLIELADETEDLLLLPETQQEYQKIQIELEAIRLTTLLKGEYDAKNAILIFHAGAGRIKAQDWVSTLYCMYCRWAKRHGLQVKTLDYLNGEEADLEGVSILIEDVNAYGSLKSEAGAHRLVRMSPFDVSDCRRTSFASLEVMPGIDNNISVGISPDDVEAQVYRVNSAGGQKVNKTSSVVRPTHGPTGIVASCQVERSQYQNHNVAMKILISKLVEAKEREYLGKTKDIKGNQKETARGSQIRSYAFMPYTLVKDRRIGFGMGNISVVMDGDLDDFINTYLKAQNLDTLGENIE